MKDFCKIFNHEEIGQILVMHDSGEDGPEIGISFVPEGLGVCRVALKFSNTDKGWDNSEKAFESIGLDTVVESIESTINGLKESGLAR